MVPGVGSVGLVVELVFLLGFPKSGPVGIRRGLRGGSVHCLEEEGRRELREGLRSPGGVILTGTGEIFARVVGTCELPN